MTHLPNQTMSRLLSTQTRAVTMLIHPSRATQVPFRLTTLSTRLYHQSMSFQDKSSAPSSSSRPQQNKSRSSFFWRRRDRKETRNRISTLALDPNATTEADAQNTEDGSHQNQQSHSKDKTGKSRDRLMSQTQQRILLFTVILSVPIIGRDVMEFIVPGLLGTIIFVGSKIKSGIKWVKRIGSGEGI